MENNIQNNIRWGQSFNLAVEMVAGPLGETKINKEAAQNEILYWQKWFYEELGKRPPEVCESCGGGNGVGINGTVNPIINGLHKGCRQTESYKQKDL